MKETRTFERIQLSNTWAQWDSPARYEVTVSNDGLVWGQSIASGTGKPGITSISFPRQTTRYIRVTQTGTDTKYNWSIYELDVFRANSSSSE
jgi:hypothetical protein